MLFGHRIVSRTDTPNLTTSKSLRKIFPSDPSMALIIDDRDDVWEVRITTVSSLFDHCYLLNVVCRMSCVVYMCVCVFFGVPGAQGPQGMHLLLVRPYAYFKSAPEVNNVSGQTSLTAAANSGHTDEETLSITEESDGQQEERPATDEKDFYLLHLAQILKGIHQEYYNRFEQNAAAPTASIDVRADASLILQQRYKETLKVRPLTLLGAELNAAVADASLFVCVLRQEVKVLFSGLIPTSDQDPSKRQLWRYAEKLGAQVVSTVAEATHLVAAKYVLMEDTMVSDRY